MSCRCSKDAGVPKETAATAALSHHHPYTAIPVPRFPLQVTHVCKSMRSCPSYCLSSLRRALCRYPLDCGGNFEHLRFAGRRATPHTSGIAVAECPTALQLLPSGPTNCFPSTAGAFLQNFSHWQPPRTVNRSVDIAFIGQTHFGGKSLLFTIE